MPITRTYAKKTLKLTSNVENNSLINEKEKENCFVKKKSKLKDGKKFPKIVSDDSFTFVHCEKKVDDSFDLLVASPLKQAVNFKPLSFWSKKVQDLECKKNSRKIKCELYELSGSDDSLIANERKKPKKKGRGKIGQYRKREKKVNKHEYMYDVKNLVKNTYHKNESFRDKEGSIVRERIILSRLNNNYSEREDKFSFKKIDSFGLTSTPERNKKLNIVGGSNFHFLSPIPTSNHLCQDNNRIDNNLNCSEKKAQKDSESRQNCFQGNVFTTPKNSQKFRESYSNKISEQNASVSIETLEKLNNNISTQSAMASSESYIEIKVRHLSERIFKPKSEGNVHDVNCSFLSRNSFNNITVRRLRNYFNYSIGMNDCCSTEADSKIKIKKDLNFLNETRIFSHSFPRTIKNQRKVNSLDFITWDTKFFHCTKSAEDNVIESISLNISEKDIHHETEILSRTDSSQTSNESNIENNCMNLSRVEIQKTECAYLKSIFILYLLKLVSAFPDLGRSAVDLRELSPPHFSNYSQQVKSTSVLLLQSDFSSLKDSKLQNLSVITNTNFSLNEINKAEVSVRSKDVSFSQISFPYVTVRRRNERDNCNVSFHKSNDFQLCNYFEKENGFSKSYEDINLFDQPKDVFSNKERAEFFCDKNGYLLKNNSKMGLNHYRSRKNDVTLLELKLITSFNVGDDSSVYNSSYEMTRDINGNGSCEQNVGDNEKIIDNLHNSNGSCLFRSITNLKCEKNSSRSVADISDLFYSAVDFTRCRNEKKNEVTGNIKRKTSLETPRTSCQRHKRSSITEDITFCEGFEFPLPIFESTAFTPFIPKKIEKVSSSKEINMETAEKRKRHEIMLEEFEDGSRVLEINTNEADIEGSRSEQSNLTNCLSKIKQFNSFKLKPGKQWARSALILKKILNGTLNLDTSSLLKTKGKNYHTFMEEVVNMQGPAKDQSLCNSMNNFSVTFVASHLSNLTVENKTSGMRTVKILKEKPSKKIEYSFRNIFENYAGQHDSSTFKENMQGNMSVRDEKIISARDLVLIQCKQERPLQFEQYFNDKTLKNCKKIGEGVFGEVFMCHSNRVLKIMPIEGSIEVNGESQKKFEEILSEITIAKELSNLQNHKKFKTKGFSDLKKCWCVIGKYPRHLINLWNEFDINRGSENDSPIIFESDQLYIILEFANGGKDLESYTFTSAEQSLSLFLQATYSLAVAEKALEFEHRDLHWGNILISQTKEKYFKICLGEKEYKIPTKGVRVTIIDFTLSRMTYDGCCIYNDLASDPTLFAAQGDYQFEIYRLMKNEVKNDWSVFEPKTNLYWLHYVLDKMLSSVRYKRTNTKIHKENLSVLKLLKSSILQYSNSEEFLFKENLFKGDTAD